MLLLEFLALALVAPLVHGETYTTEYNLGMLRWNYVDGRASNADYRFKAYNMHLNGGSTVVKSRRYECRSNVHACQLGINQPVKESGHATVPTQLGLLAVVWEEDCGDPWEFDACAFQKDDLFFAEQRTFQFSSAPSTARTPQSRSYTWNGPDGKFFKMIVGYEWGPSAVGGRCIRLWERVNGVTGTGAYQNYCSSTQTVSSAKVRAIEAGASVLAAVVAADGSTFWVPPAGNGKHALPANVAGSVHAVTLYDAYLVHGAAQAYVGLTTDGSCASFSADDAMHVYPRARTFAEIISAGGVRPVFLCVFERPGCTGRRRCWRWRSADMFATADVTAGAWGMPRGIRSARLRAAGGRPVPMTFNLVDPALDSAAPLVGGSAWHRPHAGENSSQLLEILSTAVVSSRGRTQPLASIVTADVSVRSSSSYFAMCPVTGCVGLRMTDGGAYVAYDEATGTLATTTVASRRAFFKVHRNTPLEVVVLQLLLDSYPANPLFLVVDPIGQDLALSSTPTSDSVHLWTGSAGSLLKAGDGMLDTVAREYADAVDAGSVALAAYVRSAKFAEATRLAHAFCASGAEDAPVCKVRDLADAAAEEARLTRRSQGTCTDLTDVQYVDFGLYATAVSHQFTAEQATNTILDNMRDATAEVRELGRDLAANLNTLAQRWADARQVVVRFEAGITGGDVANGVAATRNARGALDGVVKNEIAPGLEALQFEANANQLQNFAYAAADMAVSAFGVPPSGAASAANDMRQAAEGLVQIDILGESALGAVRKLGDVAAGFERTVDGLAGLHAAAEAINDAYGQAGATNDQAPVVQETLAAFVRAYADFDGGDVVDAMAAFDHLSAIIDALCDLAGNIAHDRCASLAASMSLAAGRAEEGFQGAYTAAGRMAAYAKQQVELGSLDAFKAQAAELDDGAAAALATFYDVYAVTRASYQVQRLARSFALHQVATMLCAMQRYNYMGHVSTICAHTLTGANLITHPGELDSVIASGVERTTRTTKQQVRAGLPVTSETRARVSGSVNLVKLMRGEAVDVQIPTDSAWRTKYGWHRAAATSFVKSLKVFVPVDVAGTAEIVLRAKFSDRQPLYAGDALVRHSLLETPRAEYRAQFGEACPTALPNPFAHCDDTLIALCQDDAGTFVASDNNDLNLPSLHARFTLELASAAGLDGVDFSRIPEGGMVLFVEADVVEVEPFTAARRFAPAPPTAKGAAQGCCAADGHVVDWSLGGCELCPEGSTSASSKGIYCQ